LTEVTSNFGVPALWADTGMTLIAAMLLVAASNNTQWTLLIAYLHAGVPVKSAIRRLYL
jgi:hypothetical protein